MQVNTNNAAAVHAPEYFVSQWGYEQTNVCFYKVLKRTAKMITILAVRSNRNYIDGVNYEDVPVDESPSWAEPIRRKLHKWGDKECASISSYETAFPWSGHPVGGSSGY